MNRLINQILSPEQRTQLVRLIVQARQNQSQSDAGKRSGKLLSKRDKDKPIDVMGSLGQMIGVSRAQMYRVAKLKRACDESNHPEVWEKMKDGTMKLQRATEWLKVLVAIDIIESGSTA
jgi:hypothetical protein